MTIAYYADCCVRKRGRFVFHV